MRPLFLALTVGAILVLGGCTSSSWTEYPVGIGAGPNQLKRSPCACILLPNLAQQQPV